MAESILKYLTGKCSALSREGSAPRRQTGEPNLLENHLCGWIERHFT